MPAGDYHMIEQMRRNSMSAVQVSFNGHEPFTNDDKSGWFMVVGYAQNPEAFNTIVVYADSKSSAKMQLASKHPNTQYTAIFVTRQTDW